MVQDFLKLLKLGRECNFNGSRLFKIIKVGREYDFNSLRLVFILNVGVEQKRADLIGGWLLARAFSRCA